MSCSLSFHVNNFDFTALFNEGLFYFFYEDSPIRTVVLNGTELDLEFISEAGRVEINISPEPSQKALAELKERISFCLGINEELDEFYHICADDPALRHHLERIRRTRIVSAFSDFEALVGGIISQNNSYMNYRTQMRRVYRALNFVPERFVPENLNNLRLGYKAPYIIDCAERFGSCPITEIKGIGPYTENLFRIFQKRDYNSFYIDCLTERIMEEQYGITKDLDEHSRRLWGEYRGLAEAYLQRFFEVK